MKKTTLSLLLITGLFAGAAQAFAETGPWEEVTGTEDGKGAKSQAHMTLTPGDNPTDPTTPLDPSEPDGSTGNIGALTIDNVTPLEFGEHQLEGGETIYTTTSIDPNVQVTDNRGEGKGWSLQVTSSQFTDVTDNKKTLKGAVLTLPVGEMKTTAGNVSSNPDPREIQLATDKASTEIVMDAKAKAGMGTWEELFDASKLTVKVPAGNFAGEYVSTLTWTMLDAPKA
ncbi:WxL domain-containing protein [Enterococcus caccae]|uniref:WxL domain-containing protein n=1 Tax=Enterococcus caccae ATCC BAA-1240 TaxID=1158612 RepID=R3WCL0_9ENTE|nr:WxL domain-containing protein [Enterococcus caccae]EOL45212.1 hypothetical protein UC7_02018 [Enterococcus caccae ATCC BAA-1240]EOT58619.1 hypothetical protein I580_02790 [Enterococcus caccae ATCC BAA-1240]OJG27053.1 hypothetical protein RU98_GL002833 [Enterococcus caccae]